MGTTASKNQSTLLFRNPLTHSFIKVGPNATSSYRYEYAFTDDTMTEMEHVPLRVACIEDPITAVAIEQSYIAMNEQENDYQSAYDTEKVVRRTWMLNCDDCGLGKKCCCCCCHSHHHHHHSCCTENYYSNSYNNFLPDQYVSDSGISVTSSNWSFSPSTDYYYSSIHDIHNQECCHSCHYDHGHHCSCRPANDYESCKHFRWSLLEDNPKLEKSCHHQSNIYKSELIVTFAPRVEFESHSEFEVDDIDVESNIRESEHEPNFLLEKVTTSKYEYVVNELEHKQRLKVDDTQEVVKNNYECVVIEPGTRLQLPQVLENDYAIHQSNATLELKPGVQRVTSKTCRYIAEEPKQKIELKSDVKKVMANEYVVRQPKARNIQSITTKEYVIQESKPRRVVPNYYDYTCNTREPNFMLKPDVRRETTNEYEIINCESQLGQRLQTDDQNSTMNNYEHILNFEKSKKVPRFERRGVSVNPQVKQNDVEIELIGTECKMGSKDGAECITVL